jgi:type VI secretion system (T6SS) effector TldE1-like protein
MTYVRMTDITAIADRFPWGQGISFSGTVVRIIAALALAAGMAAWIAAFNPSVWISDPASSKESVASVFDARFLLGSASNSPSIDLAMRPFGRSVPSELEIKLEQAKGLLAQRLRSQGLQAAAPLDEPTPSIVATVPLPRSRPVEANLENNGFAAAQADSRTLLQKLSDLFPVTLASLAPDGGLLRTGPDLASLGYDSFTAVYDISARAVYMPNGAKLEAHSGFGNLMDDPAHVRERNVGATPPHVYDLKPRERPFHGVQALRMIPVGDNDTLGRSGLLAHSYMLGPNGDSNGCVSIKDYDRFLNAFTNGEVKRLVVVPSLGDGMSAATRRSTSPS